ncbi:E3 ubiquitin-protein ligase RFI2 isoform X1 [Juglans microcarpa x Juglans regia]|uniref:E3 ubiquitin-protein ligase RFI2 isoform X1 n=2 Tax=Juglans microcarpa x Juglans regia TaxID=2249226 RepID=UPI001B7F63E2|nr:E3 ubiquitin-protein ligase RFI2 isoform X1 [Juglans microcarpa x Juglans regia]
MVGLERQTAHHHRLQMDGDGGGGGGGGDVAGVVAPKASGVSCSICLDLVSDDGGRSRAKLQCGHEFHLDCIGSAFNMKGEMQCPNCRKVEKGQWLYANGSTHSFPEFGVDDWNPDEDPYDLHYFEMPFRVQWCPFGELERIPPSFEEVESPSTTYHNLQEHHGTPAEPISTSSLAHHYVAYVGPIPPASLRSSDSIDEPNFIYPWNGLSGHNEIFNPHTFPASSIQYHGWGHHSLPFSQFGSHINGADPASVPPVIRVSTHSDSDPITRSRFHSYPLLYAHGSSPRAGNSFVSTGVPHYPGSNAQTHEVIHISHAFHLQQRPSNSPGIPSPSTPVVRRIEGPGVLPLIVPAPIQPDRSGSFHIVPQPPSVPNFHEVENLLPNRYDTWEREHLSHFPPLVSDRDSVWGSSHQTAADSDSVSRSSGVWRSHRS